MTGGVSTERGRAATADRETGAQTPSVQDVFQTYASFVWRAMLYLGVPEADVEDACQDVFLVVHRKLGDFEGRSTLRTWLYGICLRVAAARRRRASTQREQLVDEMDATSIEAPQEEELRRRQARELVLAALEKIDENKREVYVLHEIEQLPIREVANIVGCPLFTAYSRLRAARKKMREQIEAMLGGEKLS